VYRSGFLATAILVGEKLFTSCLIASLLAGYLIAHHLDEKSRDCKQRIKQTPA
jgi:hypothetical protein